MNKSEFVMEFSVPPNPLHQGWVGWAMSALHTVIAAVAVKQEIGWAASYTLFVAILLALGFLRFRFRSIK